MKTIKVENLGALVPIRHVDVAQKQELYHAENIHTFGNKHIE